MKHTLLAIASLFILVSSLGCQTNELKQYDKLKVGMDKGDVLDIMGSPKRSERWHGQDRWTYSFYQENQLYDKEVHFLEGKATYVGELWRPQISADEQDRLNEVSNKEVEAQWAIRRAEDKAQAAKFFNNEDAHTKIRYVPEFRPVQ